MAALSPYHALYSTELRPYPLVLAFSSLSIWAFLDLVETGARRSYALFSIATILNLYTHYFTLFLLLSQIVLWGAIFAGRLRREGRTGEEKSRLLLAGASLLFLFIAFLPWVPHLTGLFSKSVLLGETVGAGGRIGGGVTWRLIGRSLYEALGQGPLPLAAEAILVVVAVARVRSRAASLLFVSIWTVPFLLLALGKPSHFLASKYFLYAYPLGVSLAAAGLGAGEGIVRPRRTAALPSLALIVLLAALPLLPGQHPAYAFHRTDWRRVAASVEARIGPGDWISFAGDQKSYCMLGEYAPEGFLRAHRMLGWNRSALTLPAALKEAGTRLWIVRQGPPPESLVSALGGGIVPVETWALYPRAVTLFRWEASGRRLPSE